MLQENIAVRNPVIAIPGFGQTDLAASQTDAQLTLLHANDGVVMPKAGWVIGFSWKQSAAAGAGQMTIGVTVDGTEDADTTQTITTETEGYPTFKIDGDAPRFAAGQEIGLEITTDGDWDATTADIDATVFVVLEDWDF